MFPHREDNEEVSDFADLIQNDATATLLDEIASADPPAYLHRCFAEGLAAPRLAPARIRELVVGAVLIDAVAGGLDYDGLEPELIADWRAHYGAEFARLRPLAARALQVALQAAVMPPELPAQSLPALHELAQRLAAPQGTT